MYVVALNCFRESSRPKILNHLIPTSNNRIYNNWKVFCFFEPGLLSIKNYPKIITVINSFIKFCRVEFIISCWKLDPFRKNWAWDIIVSVLIIRLAFLFALSYLFQLISVVKILSFFLLFRKFLQKESWVIIFQFFCSCRFLLGLFLFFGLHDFPGSLSSSHFMLGIRFDSSLRKFIEFC